MPRNDLIQLRGGTAAQWTTADPVLAAREPGLETDTGKVKYGNGTDSWSELPYSGGGGGDTDGVGAVIFGGGAIQVPFTNTKVYCVFADDDDPPRAPKRDDLVLLDEGDATTINVIRSGLYDISLNCPLNLVNVAYSDGTGPVPLRGQVSFEVNGDNEPPAYDYNNRQYWVIRDAGIQDGRCANLTFPQVLLAGDTVQLGFLAAQSGLATISGHMTLSPDITMLMTYRGTVTL